MQENPVKLPPGIVQDQPPDEESYFGRQLGTAARVTWPWLKSKFGKQPPREEASDRDYWNGKWGKLTIEVRPFDANGQWLHNLNQEFTPDGLRDAQKYGFELMRDLPEADGFWIDARLEKYWSDKGQHQTMRMMTLGRYERARQERNPRKRAAPLREGDDNANRRRERGGRFSKSTACDFCGKSCAAEHFTDDRAVGRGDGPGFYLCGRASCSKARERYEDVHGFEALKERYAEQRAANDAATRSSAPFMDGPSGTERELERLRKQQRITARMLEYAAGQEEKVRSLQQKELELQRQIDKLVFGDEQVPNARAQRLTPSQLRLLQQMKDSTDQNGVNRFYGAGSGYKNAIELFIAQGWVTRRPNAWPAIDLTPEGRALIEAYTPNHAVHYNLSQLDEDIDAALDHMSDYDSGLKPNHAAVHYVWLLTHHGVPLDTEGPYGPMSLERAESFARIGAKEGDHDRAVSVGTNIMGDGFEILRRYRRGTGERVL